MADSSALAWGTMSRKRWGRPGPALKVGVPGIFVWALALWMNSQRVEPSVNAVGQPAPLPPPVLASVAIPSPTLPESAELARRSSTTATLGSGVTPIVGSLTLPTIGFEHASFQLDESAQLTLARIAETLRAFPTMCIRVVAYSTPREDPDPNHRLSKLRAMAIAQELTRLNPPRFPNARFDVRALGSGYAPGHKGQNAAHPRRAELGLFTCLTSARPPARH
jgi:outer membrane protein OmpA-like peptidoglycan-associated protein